MRRRLSLAVVVAIFALVLAAGSVPAAASGWAAAGMTFNDGKSEAYATAELYLNERMALGIEYMNKEIALSLWYGENMGPYGQVAFHDGTTRVEAGFWAQTALSPTVDVAGWIGATTELGGGEKVITFVARGDVYIPVSGPLFALVGVDGRFGSGASQFGGRLAIGTDF